MKLFNNLVIYYFSGTGNAKNVAIWISAVAVKYGIHCRIINIADTDRLSIDPPPAGSLVVFISPIHGFNYPPVMLHFIGRFPKGKNRVVLMNTRAGMLIGKFITPGLTGIAFYLSSVILMIKGYSIRGMIPVDMPSNWLSIHPGFNYRTVKYLHERNKERVILSAEKILSGKTSFKALREIVQDVIFSPVSLLYYFIGRFGFAKTFYASSDCNNCDICIRNCPVKAIIKVDKRPFWTFSCESCMHCMSNCPRRAIETAHGFFTGVLILNSFLPGLFFAYWNVHFIKIDNPVIKFVIGQLLFFALLAICHRVVHYGMRIKFIERLVVYTSLTRYKFWGPRYKALKNF